MNYKQRRICNLELRILWLQLVPGIAQKLESYALVIYLSLTVSTHIQPNLKPNSFQLVEDYVKCFVIHQKYVVIH